MSFSFELKFQKTYKRNDLAEKIITLALKEDLIVFGGYVRDRNILNLNTFNDIDFTCFNEFNYSKFLDSLKNEYLTISVSRKIESSPLFNKYGRMSSIISEVITLSVTGAHGVVFPENMKISIDVVMHKSKYLWKTVPDIDFSCNLFYRDQTSIGLRYIPDIKIDMDCTPFTFWKNTTINKKFYLVMGNMETLRNDQVQKLLSRADKLISKNWKMYYTDKNPFTLGFYKMIQLKNNTQCSICLNEFDDSSLIVNTRCKHSFCKECYQKVLEHSNSCPNCRGSLCADRGVSRRLFGEFDSPVIEVV